MERTESVVVQVALGYENGKIKEMQMFGWNLQGRQEIHEEGDDSEQLGYVSLHFTRSLILPNLDKVKHIEAEYLSLPFPRSPSLVGPVIFMGYCGLGMFLSLGEMSQNAGAGSGLLVLHIVWVGLGYLWLNSRLNKRQAATATCATSSKRMKELRAALDVAIS